MFTVMALVIVGFLIGRGIGETVRGGKAYVLGVFAALVLVPAAGILAAKIDIAWLGANADSQTSIAVGLGLAVALIEVPLLIYKRRSRRVADGEG